MNASRSLAGLLLLLAVIPTSARQAPDPREAFVQALAGFSLALEGAYGDEGERIRTSLDAMDRALTQWDATIGAYEAAMERERAGADASLAARMHLALGGVYLDRGRVQDGLREFDAASTLAPERADVHTLAGLARSQLTNELPEATEALRTASALDPQDPVRAYVLARHLAKAGEPAEALTALARFRDNQRQRAAEGQTAAPFPFIRLGLVPETAGLEPFFPPVLYADGFALLTRGEYERALVELRDAAARDPLNAVAVAGSDAMQRAAAAFRDGSVKAAVEHLRAAIAAAPDRAEPHRLLGLVYAAGEDYAGAAAALGTAVRLNPGDERARIGLADAHVESGDLASAEEALHETIDRLPGSGLAHYRLARIHEDQGQRPEALRELEAAVTLNPLLGVNGIYETIGSLEAARQNFDAAVEAYSARIDVHPNDPEAHHDLGDIYLRQGRHDEALAEFTVAVMLRPDHAEAHAAIAQVHLRDARYADAIESSRRAVDIEPQHEQARYTLATALIRSGDSEEGRKELDVFQRLQAQSAAARSRMFEVEGLKREAAVASAEGDHQRAVALRRRVFVLEPEAASSHLELGLAHLRAGQPAEAIDRLDTAAVLDPHPDVHRHLADAYAAMGQAEESQREMAAYERLKQEALRRRSAER